MFKSEFAREFCRSDLARSLSSVALNTPVEEEVEMVEVESQDWMSHHNFKQILQRTEKSIGSQVQTGRRVSQTGLSPVSPDPLARLELENHQLRRQLELVGRPGPGPDMDSKYSSLATEVVRLQNTVSQMEQSKMFYESSTRQLVNILESLSSQLTGPCNTRHFEDTDSFDSVLSRRSSDHSSLISRPSNESSSRAGREEAETVPSQSQSPSYENIFFDSVTLTEPEPRLAPRPYRRHDSLHCVLPPPPPQPRSRILMGSSSVRRAMSNRTANEHVKSFVAIGEEPEIELPHVTTETRKQSYSRSKSVASGLPRLGTKSDQLGSRNAENKGLSKFFKQMKSFVSKDKIKKSKTKPEAESLTDHLDGVKFRQQSHSYLTPRKLKQVQHHSTPRLTKDV